MAERGRVLITVTTRWEDGSRFELTLDAPCAGWGLDQLHELAREMAESASMTSEMTTAIEVAVAWPETAGASIER